MSQKTVLALAGVCVLAVVAAVVGVMLSGSSELPQPPEENTPEEPVILSEDRDPEETSNLPYREVDDDGQTLWAAPAEGEPISLSYLPLGTRLILHIRPAELFAHPESDKLLAAIGPWGAATLQQVEEVSGVKLQQVQALTVAVHPGATGALHNTWRLEFDAGQSPLPEPREHASGRVCFAPDSAKGRVLVCCPKEDLQELKAQGDEPALFGRDMQRLLDQTDVRRSVTVVFDTRFLKTEGHELLQGNAEPIEELLAEIGGDEATAIALSADWDDSLFLELRSNVTLNVRPYLHAEKREQWITDATERLRSALAEESMHPYGRQVVQRLPNMLRVLSEYTRGGQDEQTSVLRCYLPTVAGHNLLMAGELLLSLPEGSSAAETSQQAPRTIHEKLDQTTSLVFTKDTLEQALKLLGDDIGVEIRIAGSDLQLEGITKNQSFGIELRDKSAREILEAILALANPDRTATGLADVKQKLVYVLQDAESTDGVIVVTTRAAAAKRGDQLPQAFTRSND